MSKPGVAKRVKLVMIGVLDLPIAPDQLPEDTPLYSTMIRLDSLTLLNLITELEKAFCCQIDDEAVMTADLINVGSLIALVESQLTK